MKSIQARAGKNYCKGFYNIGYFFTCIIILITNVNPNRHSFLQLTNLYNFEPNIQTDKKLIDAPKPHFIIKSNTTSADSLYSTMPITQVRNLVLSNIQ